MELLSSFLGSAWSIFLIVLFFGGSIFVHELGHFLAARRRGVKVERFSIGFGPRIFGWRGRDGVEYRLSWFPLGGYVALPQLADMSEIEGESSAPAAELPPISYSTKLIVFAAGAFFNVLFAFALATILWFMGLPSAEDIATTRIGYVAPTLSAESKEPSPASKAGLKPGDIVVAIDGREISDWPELIQTLVTSTGRSEDGRRRAVFTVKRGGETLHLTLYPEVNGDEKQRRVGIVAGFTPIVDSVKAGSIAATAGLQQNDELIGLDGVELWHVQPLRDALVAGREFTLSVRRGDRTLKIAIPSQPDAVAKFGCSFRQRSGLIYVPPWKQIGTHIEMTKRVLLAIIHPSSDVSLSQMSGPVGIGRIFWQASEVGLRYVLWIAVLVNVNLAIFNLLPIPVLDGGHMLFATIARLRGRALAPNLIASFQSVFVVLLFGMMIYVTIFGDLRRWVRDVRTESQAREAAEEQKK
jgi:regulator of sigma E protease